MDNGVGSKEHILAARRSTRRSRSNKYFGALQKHETPYNMIDLIKATQHLYNKKEDNSNV